MQNITSIIDNTKSNMGKAYYENKVFTLLKDIECFYDFVSQQNFSKSALIVKTVINIDYGIYSSLEGTIESINCLLNNGRINDAFALIRKYNDAIIVDIYKSILIEKEEQKFRTSLDTGKDYKLYDNVINNWANYTQQLYNEKDSKKVYSEIKKFDDKLFDKFDFSNEGNYKKNRDMCNDNVHYNSWRNFSMNNNKLYDYDNTRTSYLNQADIIIQELFSIHFAYILLISPEYLISSDYVDYLDCGEEPLEGSENWVAPIVQDMFDKYITNTNKDLAMYLKSCNFLELK